MKKELLKSAFLICFLVFTFAGGFAQSNAELKASIEKINKELAAAMLSGNIEKSLSFYTVDVISMPNQGKMLEGKEALKKSNEEMKQSGVKVVSFEPVVLKVMSCDKTITEIGTYKMALTIPGQSDPIKDHGKYITVWEKQTDGSLKIKLEIWNTDVSPMDAKM